MIKRILPLSPTPKRMLPHSFHYQEPTGRPSVLPKRTLTPFFGLRRPVFLVRHPAAPCTQAPASTQITSHPQFILQTTQALGSGSFWVESSIRAYFVAFRDPYSPSLEIVQAPWPCTGSYGNGRGEWILPTFPLHYCGWRPLFDVKPHL